MNAKKCVTIIVPVYGDWESLERCILSLKKNVSNHHKVIFANDRGPEHDVIEKNIIELISDNSNFHYRANTVNLGFLQNCNNAVLNFDKTSNDIILLNSDTITTKGFIEELIGVAESNSKIATACPRSNNATIASVPQRFRSSNVNLSMDRSYDTYLTIKDLLPTYTISPVSVGFCLYIKRNIINKYGLFDEVFGKGYGEEDDFCMRMNKLGYISVIANHAFVYHQGARSFTEQKRNEILEVNAKTLVTRYPYFPHIVSNYQNYPERFAEYFAESIYERSKKSSLKILIDLHSHPAHDMEYTPEIKSFLKNLKSGDIEYDVVSSLDTWQYFDINNDHIQHIEPHRLNEQYDFSYSPAPVTDMNNIRMLRSSSMEHVFHQRNLSLHLNNEYSENRRLFKGRSILLIGANIVSNTKEVNDSFFIRLKSRLPDYDLLQEKWEKLDILCSDEITVEESYSTRVSFVHRYLKALKGIKYRLIKVR